MNRFRFVLPLAAACLLLQGCEVFDSSADEPDRALTEAGWTLLWVADVEGRPMLFPQSGEAYRIEFDADGKGRGVDACNWCGVTYALGPGDAISIEMRICTEIACRTHSLGYSYAVSRATSYTIRGNRLRIRSIGYDGEAIVLVHQAREKGKVSRRDH